ncbi:MAG: serine/threonine protein kinase [Gemmatimonadetes bacterium]|nr:serine/threonine protein kinase [Gemmatimonadota bacterium]
MWLSDRTLEHLRAVADAPDLSGTRYRLIAAIGRGGMGTVYRAEDTALRREVALKVLRAPEILDVVARRMIDEARILARLEHPGIVPVYDAGTLADGRAYYAMKLVRGEQLEAWIARSATLNERLRVFRRICEAVGFANAHGVVHRDLKPQNIMVGAFGEVMVMDWGIARRTGHAVDAGGAGAASAAGREDPDREPGIGAQDPASRETEDGARGSMEPRAPTTHGMRLGTPGWMAPEQERAEHDRIDARTDVWGLGAILRFMLAGAVPADDDPAQSLRRIPRPLRAIADRATQPAREERYDSAEALAADVDRFLAGLRVEAYEERLHERLARFTHKYRTPILLVLTYLVMRILLIAFGRG